MLITRYQTPGDQRDAGPLSSPFYDLWHQRVVRLMPSGIVDRSAAEVTPVAERSLVWTGLSRERLVLNTADRDDRPRVFAGSDDREQQFEYLEWHTQRDKRGRITRVTFSTEVPEYWTALAEFDPTLVVRLYRSLVSPAVRQEDVFSGSGASLRYEPENDWNARNGIVHMINSINRLGGALSVTANGASSGGMVTDNYATRESPGLPHAADPRVILDARGVARLGFQVAPREPIGLYIGGWDDTGWSKPDGSPVGDYWRIVRGRPGAALRVVYEVPASAGFTISDIRIGGRPVEYGGHLAEHVTVTVGALAVRYGR